MKTGKVAKLFGIDPKTVTGWVDEFAEFFSSGAKGEESTQRDYLTEDLIVLNTIKNERSARTEIEVIRAKLRSGHRDTVLPPDSAYMDKDNALAIYGQMKALQTQIEAQIHQIEGLQQVIKDEREQNAQKQMELNNEIRKLEREIGGLEAELRILKESKSDAE